MSRIKINGNWTGILLVFFFIFSWLTIQYLNQVHAIPLETEFKITDGREIVLRDLEGKSVLVNFWASTCGICVQDIPELVKLYDQIDKEHVEFIAVAMPYDPPNRVLELKKELGINYPIALDIDGNLTRVFGNVSATPSHFVLIDGNVIYQNVGSFERSTLKQELIDLISTNNPIKS